MDSEDDEDQFAEHSRLRRDRFMMLSRWWFQQHMAWVDEEEVRMRLACEAAASRDFSRKDYIARMYIWDLTTWSSKKFKRRMRMTKLCFRQLLTGFVKSPSYIAAGCLDSRRITPQVWLAAAIRDLASGTTLGNVCESLGIEIRVFATARTAHASHM